MCSKCRLFFDRIDVHLHNQHQPRRKSQELEYQINKSKTLTKHFLEAFNRQIQHDSLDSERSIEKSKKSANHIVDSRNPNSNTQNLHENK